MDWGEVVRFVGEEGGPENRKNVSISCHRHSQFFTIASGSISSVSLVTCTGEALRSVCTVSVRVTVISGSIGTLINICELKASK